MSFETQELDLLAAFQQRFAISSPNKKDESPDTRVLSSAEFVANNSIDVFIDRSGIQLAAESLYTLIRNQSPDPHKPSFSTANWSHHELHPRPDEFGEQGTLNFIFTMDLLNFCFWSDRKIEEDRFCIEYSGRRWTGYWSLVAALRRALEEDIPITSSDFWQCEEECNDGLMQHVFRSATDEEMPLLQDRLNCLKEAGHVLYKRFDCSFSNCIKKADKSAARLVNILADYFKCFRDEYRWEDEKIRFQKRAQILVADLWACFDGKGPGEFHDVDTAITAFADYRIPQMLHSLSCIHYSPPLDVRIRQHVQIENGHSWEIQIRGCTIWAVELIRRLIQGKFDNSRVRIDDGWVEGAAADRNDGPAAEQDLRINSILLDFFLYDTVKAREAEAKADLAEEQGIVEPQHVMIPHHRTRCIWY